MTLSLILMVCVISSALARPASKLNEKNISTIKRDLRLEPDMGVASRADTTFLFASSGPGAWGMPGTDSRGYTFNNNEVAGWTTEDASAQSGFYWHVAAVDINLGEPTEPIITVEQFDAQPNNFALWCGAQGECGWIDDVGYGSNWKQWAVLETTPANPGGSWNNNLDLDFWYISDFEGDTYDYFQVLLEVGDELEVIYENRIGSDRTLRHLNVDALAADFDGPVRDVYFYFTSDGGWSDEDGDYLSNQGAVWIDAVTLTVDGSVAFQSDFESGVLPDGITLATPPAAGDYAKLYANLYNEDVCLFNTSHAWAFFDIGTTNPEYPIGVVLYGPPGLDNYAVSPILDRAHGLDDPVGEPFVLDDQTSVVFDFWIYWDMPQNAEVYYQAEIGVYSEEIPCIVYSNSTIFYGGEGYWGRPNADELDVTLKVVAAAQGNPVHGVKVKVGAVDQCEVWCGTDGHGDGTGHTPAPYFDNVRVMLVNESAIAWDIDEFNRFQDNFPLQAPDGAGGAAGMVRIDNSNNIEDTASSVVVRGDSSVIELNMDLSGEIAQSMCSEAGEIRPELWLYFRVTDGPNADTLDPLMGDPDASDGIHSPYEPSQNMMLTQGGDTREWGAVRCDYAKANGTPSIGRFAFDFNDGYFEPGDRILFFYRAKSGNGDDVTMPEYATASDEDLRGYYVVRALPTTGRTMLFVDDGYATSRFWREAFRYNGYLEYDQFYTQAYASGQENALGGMGYYDAIADYWVIVWDSDGSTQYTVTTAENGDKTDDAALLTQWLNTNTHDTYFWLLGDRVGTDLGTTSFLNNTMGVTLMYPSTFYDDITGISSPLVYATHPALEYLGGEPTYWVEGGCPFPNDFAVVSADAGNPLSIMTHEFEVPILNAGDESAAGILNQDPDGNGTDVTAGGHTNRTLMMPYAYYNLRDTGYASSADRIYMRLMVGHILENLFGALPGAFDAVPEGVPAVTQLQGNFPNPFNPETQINFSLATPEHVNLAVYDISGRLVRTLVNGKMNAGAGSAKWNGTDNNGQHVSSGVYFYKLNAGDYSATDKMVMVK